MRKQLCNLLALHAGQTITQALAVEIVGKLFPDEDETPKDAQGIRAKLLRLCGGDEDAMGLINGIWQAVEIWDDCIDRDHMEPEATVNQAFIWMLCEKDQNPFLKRHPHLVHALRQMAVVWMAANRLERSGVPYKVNVAHTLRCSPYLFFVAVVTAAAGTQPGVDAAELLFGSEFNDTLAGYMAEHTRS